MPSYPMVIKTFIRSHLNFADVIYDQAYNSSFHEKLESLQYTACLAITHFYFHCPNFHTPRKTLLNNIRNINEEILYHGEDQLIQTILYGNPNAT